LAVLVASLVAGVGSSNPVPQQGAARVDDVGVVLVILDGGMISGCGNRGKAV
jgi:hypothetical protein